MLVLKIIFTLVAVALFVIVFFQMIRKNDTSFVSILIIEAIGIMINFIEISLGEYYSIFWLLLEILLSIIIPLAILLLEKVGKNFSEILNVPIARIFMMFVWINI